jgi:hypothetical protein
MTPDRDEILQLLEVATRSRRGDLALPRCAEY